MSALRITEHQFSAALAAAMSAVSAAPGAAPRYHPAVSAALAALGIEIIKHAGAGGECGHYGSKLDPCPPGCASGTCVINAPREPAPCRCSRTVREYCESENCQGGADLDVLWVERTIADVRTGDVIRPVGQESAAATVVAIGPVCAWHVDHAAGADAQFRPQEHRAEWSARRITLSPLAGDQPDITPEHGMNPGHPVEIRISSAELAAIELLGGWAARLDPAYDDVDS